LDAEEGNGEAPRQHRGRADKGLGFRDLALAGTVAFAWRAGGRRRRGEARWPASPGGSGRGDQRGSF
jgi:hypothetical protein